MKVTMERYCRLCTEASKNLSLVSIHKLYSAENDTTVPLANIIRDYLTISLNGPHCETLICFDCHKTIEDWHVFREKCLENEKHFQKQEIHFEVVITSDAVYETHSEQCNATDSETVKHNCNDADRSEQSSQGSPSVVRDAESPVAKRVSLLETETGVKDNEQSAKKFRRRLKPRRTVAEKTKPSRGRLKRGRPKAIDNESKDQKRPLLKRKRVKQRVLPKICTVCGVSRTDMVAHMRWHNDERPYECPFCPKVFVNSSNLRNHINLHTREKLYKCELCDKEFPSSTARSKHRETHSTVNVHLCAICGKSFKYRASLARHKQIHFVEPKVKCTKCDMVFLTKTRLTKHMLVHLDLKPFTCDICNRSFNRKDNLKTHMKTHMKTVKTETVPTPNGIESSTANEPTV